MHHFPIRLAPSSSSSLPLQEKNINSTATDNRNTASKPSTILKSLLWSSTTPAMEFYPRSWSNYVVFVVGPEKEKMFALKSQLISKTQAFSEIIYSGKEVVLPEYSAAAFEIFIKYINTDNLCFAESHICDLLRIAFVYDVPHIITKCKEFAMATLSLENCLKYQLTSFLYEIHELQHQSFRFMVRQGPGFLSHPSFLELDPITLGSIIGRDDFPVVETDLFLRLLEWVDAECKRLRYPPDKKEFHRRVCGNLFQHVRFAMMTPKEFSSLVIPTEILNKRDVEAVNLRHLTPWQLWPTLPPYQYIDRPRVVRQWISVPLYNQVQFNYKRSYCQNAQESLRFLTSQDIYLIGIEFFGPVFNAPLTSYKIKYQVENEFMNGYYKTPPENASILTPHDFEIEFPHPYKICAQFPHKVTVHMEGQISQYALFPVPQAVVVYNNNQVCIQISDNQKETWGSSYHVNFNTEQTESPGVIKSLLFQTID